MSKGDLFSQWYLLSSKLVKEQYYVFDVTLNGNVTPEEHSECLGLYQSFYHKKEDLVTEEEQPE